MYLLEVASWTGIRLWNSNYRCNKLWSEQYRPIGQPSPVGYAKNTILLRAYFFGPVTDKERENLSVAGTEVIADFPEGYTIEESCLSLREHQLEMFDFWAFMRAELDDVQAQTANS